MAHPDSPNWTSMIGECISDNQSFDLLRYFLDDISPLNLKSEQVKGNVAIIGQGHIFPERALVCTVASEFRKLSDRISLLACFDNVVGCDLSLLLDEPVIRYPETDKLSTFPRGAVVDYSYGAQAILNGMLDFDPIDDNFFDTIMAFRIPDLGKQLYDQGLLPTIARVLKPDGHFIGSGGSLEGHFGYSRIDRLPNLRLIQSATLFPVTTGGSFPGEHVGVIMQKTI